jgi:hypothetical protein
VGLDFWRLTAEVLVFAGLPGVCLLEIFLMGFPFVIFWILDLGLLDLGLLDFDCHAQGRGVDIGDREKGRDWELRGIRICEDP